MTVRPAGFELPVPSTDLAGPVELHDTGTATVLIIPYVDAGGRTAARLSFDKGRAYRYRAEVHCTAEQIEHAYDVLVEVENAPWAEEVRNDTTQSWRDHWALRHFRIYFDSNGCYEFLAESWSIDT